MRTSASSSTTSSASLPPVRRSATWSRSSSSRARCGALAFLRHGQLDAADAQAIAGVEHRAIDALVVDEGTVGAVEILDVQFAYHRGHQPAMGARDQGGVEDEIGMGGAAHGFDGAFREAEDQRF